MTMLTRPRSSTTLLTRLVDSPELARDLRALSGPDFSALVRRIGVEDCGELLALATSEQLVAAFDEDLFVGAAPGEREAFDPERFLTWLEVLLEAGDDVAARRISELSADFVVQALSTTLLVFEPSELAARVSEDDEAGMRADKSLESALSEEIDGYLLVAKAERGWDALVSLVLALDRDHRPELVSLLDQCVALSRPYLDDLEALSDVLSDAEALAEDVEGAREDRRAKLGYVEPRAAKGFLAFAAEPLAGELSAVPRDATTRAYFRELEVSRPGRPTPSTPDLGRAVEALGGSLPPASGGRGPSGGELAEAPELALGPALRALRVRSVDRFDERLEELAYLTNVLVAGASLDGARLSPLDAAQAAAATVALGAALEAASTAAEDLCAMLERHPADLLFRRASAALASLGETSPARPAWVRPGESVATLLAAVLTAATPRRGRESTPPAAG